MIAGLALLLALADPKPAAPAAPAEAVAPNPAVSLSEAGRAIAAGRLDQARAMLGTAVAAGARGEPVDRLLADLALARGEFEAAVKTSEGALTIDPGNVNARLIQSAALMGQKKYGASRTILDAMLKSAPSSPDVLFQLGVVNLAEGKYKEAEDAFRRAYQLNPANSRGLMGVVETYMAQNKPDAALSLLPGYELWLVMDQTRSWPVAWLAFALHSFRMTTFFLLAGYFGRMMLVRRGTRAFVSNRARRILAPLLIFWLPVLILFALALVFAASLGAIPTPKEPP